MLGTDKSHNKNHLFQALRLIQSSLWQEYPYKTLLNLNMIDTLLFSYVYWFSLGPAPRFTHNSYFIWNMGELLNYGWTFLWVNFWIMGELLNYGCTFEIQVNFWIMGKLLNMGDLLKYGWTFEIKVNC